MGHSSESAEMKPLDHQGIRARVLRLFKFKFYFLELYGIFPQNIFHHLQLAESTDVEPANKKANCTHVSPGSKTFDGISVGYR